MAVVTNMKRFISFVLATAMLALCSCTNTTPNNTEENSIITQKSATYIEISQSDAKALMDDAESDYIIIDVRTVEEYGEGHIPGAIVIPHEEINERAENELPDKSQLILVYCRSGRRSKIAAQALADLGYTNVKEFGGIIDWQYEIIN